MVTYTQDWLQLAKPILSESARRLGGATIVIRYSNADTDTARALFLELYLWWSGSARPWAGAGVSYSLSINAVINSCFLWSHWDHVYVLRMWSTNALIFLGCTTERDLSMSAHRLVPITVYSVHIRIVPGTIQHEIHEFSTGNTCTRTRCERLTMIIKWKCNSNTSWIYGNKP